MGSTQGASVVPDSYSQRVIASVQAAINASGMSEVAFAQLVEGDISRTTLRRRLAGSPFITKELEAIARALDVPVEQFGAPGLAA